MTQEEKQLLLKDLCARLPYGVKYNYGGYDGCDYKLETISPLFFDSFPIEDCKPYLRPRSSLTWKEMEELSHYENSVQRTDFFYAHHIDCRFLIEKGLALEAPNDMYKTE